MSTLCVLIVIDTAGALASGSLMNNAYLVDSNGYLGSWQEGTDALHTICQDGQMITWNAVPVSPSSDVAILGFSGAMVSKGICAPSLQGGLGQQPWSGQVEARGQFASFSYGVHLSLEETVMSLSSFLKVV